MISYKEQIFCSFYENCRTGKNCPKALTPELWEKAKNWWTRNGTENLNSTIPISQYANAPDCWEVRRNEK